MAEDIDIKSEKREFVPVKEVDRTLATIGRLVQVTKPLVEKVANNASGLKKFGWGASWRRDIGSNHESSSLNAGGYFPRDGGVEILRGPKGEHLQISLLYKPSSDRDEDPYQLLIEGGTDDEPFQLVYYRDEKTIGVEFTTEQAVYDLHISERRGIEVMAIPRLLGQVEITWENVAFEPEKESTIELKKDGPVKVRFAHSTVPKETVQGVDGVLDWYEDIRIQDKDVGKLKEWLSNLPSEVNFQDALERVEEQVGQTVEALSSVAENPSLGKEWSIYEGVKRLQERQVKLL